MVAVLTLLIALADWSVGNRASLGVFYILPMVLGATVLNRWETAGLAIVCASLRSCFDIPSPQLEMVLRFIFATLAYAVSALFVTALMRNRRMVEEHLKSVRSEQELRREAEEQLRLLVDSSPAAVITLDGAGVVLGANRAAGSLFAIPENETLKGRAIGEYLPVLSDALALTNMPDGFRTAAQCTARRSNGDVFLAHTWFSSYAVPEGTRLAAIVVDASEELREREEEGLHQLLAGNRIAAAAVSHEVRNLCSAIWVICSSLKEKHDLARDDDFQQLAQLVNGLERIASIDLQRQAHPSLEKVQLQEVLDDLRIVIQADWKEAGGAIRWRSPASSPMVLAERHGLLQSFLNLAQNSHRAVQECSTRELSIVVSRHEQTVRIDFDDTGPGVAAPEQLFTPFQPGSDGTGLGLYISRAVLRSYGGDLRYKPHSHGAGFTVELQAAE